MNDGKKFYGKYRGTVLNNIDPLRVGRVQVAVPDIPHVLSSWAMPCVPLAGFQTGMYMVPPMGAGVWVEFEQGDPDHPIYVGGWWGSAAEVPATAATTAPAVSVFVLQSQSPTQNAIVVSDVPVPPMLVGGVMLKAGLSSVTVDPSGVTITAPKIQINGLTLVNNGALTVTL